MNLEDRELLDLAAKASGVDLWWDGDSPKEVVQHWSGNPEDGGETRDYPWNPLADLDQAKNLRHRLCLSTGYDDRFFGPCAYATYPTGPDSCNSIMQSVAEAGGKRAALRRAIVRAAAEMGKAMQEKH
ncbi:hypothetical protein ACI2JC_21155 [Pseudomonas fulva]|uniref:hypothetical protein n=1 Tax=Pseudomonas fulva TaxID=47880 RepID=UPI00384F56FB